ncbi:ammonia-dependent NAD(+) synthetase [Facklamia sp. DSM 111018]|uniref:NH(3)-dependent NAD(+) synthetase n=1 Tax=Facklamia lactis TaxID=2749967 RepID=A0ABS0LSE4_9LACT|nr:ammonia-dependent NAD(+) synthetase [Facklamia lactis]MBG9981438.1 ammonia-dependent NAD(+) synthetase [Facklamia lactis]MBG9987086.1 ammonia-dependent NAD(+) synthetase [Facklamia lactis]
MRPLQAEIIKSLCVKPHIDPEKEVKQTIEFLKEYLKKHKGLKSYVLGISGGQDSTLAGKLTQIAVEEIRQETQDDSYQFIAVRLPYGRQNDEQDALAALKFIEPDKVFTLNIQMATDSMVKDLKNAHIEISDYNKGNVKARQRMIMQYVVAGHFSGAVIGTDHAAESVTGFYTKYGDGAADIVPLWRLTKGQGRQMLQYLGCPEALYRKIPTADLEEERPMLSDEEALGVSYEVIDEYLQGKSITEKEAETIEAWYLKTQHKRHMPITIFDDFWR